jgi:hypothetical protein
MLYFFRFLLLQINIDQETVLNWFGIENLDNRDIFTDQNYLSFTKIQASTEVSIETLRLIIEGLWEKVQDGLTLSDIENVLFFILFLRFVILAIRYNIKTSFYITCIGLFAGYLWYRHLIDLISLYRNILLKLPFLHKLGIDAIQLRALSRSSVLTDLKLNENVHWYDPGKLIYYSFTRGIVDVDPETGIRNYIDPISMIVSNLNEPLKSTIIPYYYKVYSKIIPKIFEICSKLWSQMSGIVAYAVITRIGKRYCPYLIRWHWTLLLIIGLVEHVFMYFIYRIYYFQSSVLIPQTQMLYSDPNLGLQINALNGITACLVSVHIGLILFGMLHAIWGQYFYFPFFVENAELHIGPRPKNSIYSGGNTAWQDEKEKNVNRVFPKFWYGWFGSGTKDNDQLDKFLKVFTRLIKRFKKQFRR